MSSNYLELESKFRELAHTYEQALLNFQICKLYDVKRKEFVNIMNQDGYLLFFRTSIHAHFVSFIFSMYRFYETNPKTHNIKNLLRDLRKVINVEDEDRFSEIEKIVMAVKPFWVKVSIVRNKAFGHRNSNKSIDEIFNEANVTIEDLEYLLVKSLEIICILYGLINVHYAFSLKANKSIENILNDLKQ